MNKGFTVVDAFIIMVIIFVLFVAVVPGILSLGREAELLEEHYDLKCKWYEIRACRNILERENGKDNDYNIKLEGINTN